MSTHDEWLAWRKLGIGASDVAGILGLSPWASPWSVWADKVGLTDGIDDTESMEFGRRAEPMLADYFHDRSGLVVSGEQTWCTHPKHDFMRATVDGFAMADEFDSLVRAVGPVEFKTTSEQPWEKVPEHYQAQATHIANVTGFATVYFGVLHLAFGRPQFRVYEFTPDDADRTLVADAVTRFWTDHVLTGTPPATDGTQATTEALGAAWGETTDEPVELDEPIRRELQNLHDLKKQIKRLEDKRAEMENAVKAALADHEAGEADGWRITWKPQTRTSLDAKALTAEHPDLAEKFAKTTTTRVLRVTPPKET